MNNQIVGDLIVELYKQFKMRIENMLRPFDLGMGQLQVLMVFYRNNVNMTQKALVLELGVDKANISRSIAKLLEKGYLVSSTDVKGYQLSEKGRTLKVELIPILNELNLMMLSGIDHQDIEIISRGMTSIIDNLEEQS